MLRMKFSSNLRLKKSSEYQNVFDRVEIRLARGPLIVFARSNELPHPRLGLIARKKNLRFAHQRHLVKRLIRENFRLRQNALPQADIIFMSRGPLQGDRENLHVTINKLMDDLIAAKSNDQK